MDRFVLIDISSIESSIVSSIYVKTIYLFFILIVYKITIRVYVRNGIIDKFSSTCLVKGSKGNSWNVHRVGANGLHCLTKGWGQVLSIYKRGSTSAEGHQCTINK